jgi:predicted dehydrogenase
MAKSRFAFFGAGYFARLQMSAWKELQDVECVALYNRTRAKGETFAREFGIPRVYDHPEELLREERVDFVDLCTNPFSLPDFVRMMAAHKVPVISQKPMAPSVAIGEELVRACRQAGIQYLIHENWRWQGPIRQLKQVLDSGLIGAPFRARIWMVSGFPVFVNEPTLNDLENFILTDMGTHLLDIARFYFGEPRSVYCQNQRIHKNIKGEDISSVLMTMGENRTSVFIEMGYPEIPYENDIFPQTLIFVEGEKGTAEVTSNYWVRVTTRTGTQSRRYAPAIFKWSNPNHMIVDASIVACHEHLLRAMRGEVQAETPGEDNLRTIRLVWACYESAREGKIVHLK